MKDELAERRLKKQVNPALIEYTKSGEQQLPFTCSFIDDDGIEIIFRIWARDWDHAEARIKTLRKSAKVDGVLCEEIDE